MSSYENLVRLRRIIAEFKIYITRTQTYLAPFQLFMIFVIFLNTTIWNLNAVQAIFGSKINFIIAGTLTFIVGVLVLGYIDTRLRIYGIEQARINAPERNPFTPLFVLWTALLLSDEKIRGTDLEKKISNALKEVGAENMYANFKSTINKATPKNKSATQAKPKYP